MCSIEAEAEVSPKCKHLEEVIAIDVIASTIFSLGNFTPGELALCSLVNKRWRTITRQVLKTSINCELTIVLKPKEERSNLEKLRWLQSTRHVNFYRTIRMIIPDCSILHHTCRHGYKKLLSQLKKGPFRQSDFKILEIEDGFEHRKSCEALQVVRAICKMLSSSSNAIEDITVYNQSLNSVLKLPSGRYLFPKAECITFRNFSKSSPNFDQFLIAYPALEHVISPLDVSELKAFWSLEKTHLLRCLNIMEPMTPLEMNVLVEFSQNQPRLIELNVLSCREKYEASMKTILSSIFKSSHDILGLVRTTLPVLKTATESLTLPLSSLGKLQMHYDAGAFEANILPLVFHAARFPCLTTVEFTVHEFLPFFTFFNDVHSVMLGNMNMLQEFSVPSVVNLAFKRADQYYYPHNLGLSLESKVIHQVAQVFPRVKNFSYVGTEWSLSEFEFYVTCFGIWSACWEELEAIMIGVELRDLSSCAEAVILGISNDERAHWLDLQDQGVDLGRMHFASSERSIRNSPKFRQFLLLDSYDDFAKEGGSVERFKLFHAFYHKRGWVQLWPLVGF